jgi:ADP-heptose:LPS heptosyltransferase
VADARLSLKLTVVSLQTFGDYLLKAPFFYELLSQYPQAEVTVVTNSKGALVYPLIDSRLRIAEVDKSDPRLRLFAKLFSIPRADILFLVDTNPSSYLVSLAIRARRRVGWQQSVSSLFHGPGKGFRDFYHVTPSLQAILGIILDKKRLREPESYYEGFVELLLFDTPITTRPALSQYRGEFSFRPERELASPTILCATLASWRARQLRAGQWIEIVQSLLKTYPEHRIVIDAANDLFARMPQDPHIQQMARSDRLEPLFNLVYSADVVICSDSFLCHLASWLDVPAVVFFGSASPHRFAPKSPGSSVLFHKPDCSPCIPAQGEEPCLAGHRTCLSLQQITCSEVCEAVAKAIATRSQAANPA